MSKKQNNNKSSPSDKAKDSKASYNKAKKSKQGKMDKLHPFDKIVTYETESESDNDNNSNTEEHQTDSDVEDVTASHRVGGNSLTLDQLMRASVGMTGHNILVSALKNKGCLLGVDCGEVCVWKQGKGSKQLKGKDLKRYLIKKPQKMSLAQICRAGAHLTPMAKFLNSAAVHLNSSQEYVEMASDITAHICWILTNIAFMENVDSAAVLHYFSNRFADLRNRGNYERK